MVKVNSRNHISYQDIYDSCNSLLTSGFVTEAARTLKRFPLNNVPREHKQKIAYLMYRSGLHGEALELLRPIVYPTKPLSKPVREIEVATFAVALIKLGSNNEAKKLLRSLTSKLPEVDLYLAFAEQTQWNYVEAMVHLRRYLAHQLITPYQRAVAEVNLLAGLINNGEYLEAYDLMMNLQKRIIDNNWQLLHKNIAELRGQLAMSQNNLDWAEKLLLEWKKSDSQTSSIYDFFFHKWLAIIAIKRNYNATSLQNLLSVRANAGEIRHWESIRECDRVLAIVQENQDLFNQLYFGTPYMAYREKLIKECENWVKVPREYVYGNPSGKLIDIASGSFSGQRELCAPGRGLHRLLTTLLSDFYRPLFGGYIFEKVFPDERYIAQSSLARVGVQMSRLREKFSELNLPIYIQCKKNFYRLIFDGNSGIGFRLNVDNSNVLSESATEVLRLNSLRDCFAQNDFSAKLASMQLNISKSTSKRVLSWGVKKGLLTKAGSGPATTYRFAS